MPSSEESRLTVERLGAEAQDESRAAVHRLIDVLQDPNEPLEVRRLAWAELEKVYYSTSDEFSAWADRLVTERNAKRP